MLVYQRVSHYLAVHSLKIPWPMAELSGNRSVGRRKSWWTMSCWRTVTQVGQDQVILFIQLGQSYMNALILTSLLLLMGISTDQQSFFCRVSKIGNVKIWAAMSKIRGLSTGSKSFKLGSQIGDLGTRVERSPENTVAIMWSTQKV